MSDKNSSVAALPLSNTASAQSVLTRALRSYKSPAELSKNLLTMVQAVCLHWAGCRIHQEARMKMLTLKGKMVATYMDNTVPSGLRFLVEVAGVTLPRELTRGMMGKTNKSDTGV